MGAKIAPLLKPGDVIGLFGNLGSGKTTFVKGLAQGLKVKPAKVSSPTFVLLNIYQGRLPVYHFDLYRLDGEQSIGGLGYEEFLYGNGVAVVEWAEKLKHLMPKEYLKIEILHKGEDKRLVRMQGYGKRYKDILKRFYRQLI